MLDATKLATLGAVIEHGSFSAAGKALGLTQPTEAGRILAGHAQAVADRLARAEADIAELAGLRRGRVRLGSFFTAFAQLAPEIDALAQERLPDLEVEHELVDRPTAFERLATGDLDLAVVFEHDFEPHPPPAGIELRPLFADPLRVLLPARHRPPTHH